MNPLAQSQIALLEIHRDRTLEAARALPESYRFKSAGACRSHPLWIVGHCALSLQGLIFGMVLGEPITLSDEWKVQFGPDFGGGRLPEPDPALYPAWDGVLAGYEASFGVVIERIGSMNDEELTGPARGEMPGRLRHVLTSPLNAVSFALAHDAYHRGQISLIANLA